MFYRGLAQLTLFFSAFLLFVVQPMFARILLPHVGGAAAVWTAAMLGFQAMLLTGYLAARQLSRVPVRWSLGFHLLAALMALLVTGLPHSLATLPPRGREVFWILEQQTWIVGLPFVLLAASSPLLQHAYAHSRDRKVEAYRLYVASNAGSFAGLLAYPFVVERFIGVSAQYDLWRGGLLLWALLLSLHILRFRSAPASVERRLTKEGRHPAALKNVARWTLLALVPSSLMLGVTSHLTHDLSPIPFIWIVPLSLYLLSMIVAFIGRGPSDRRVAQAGLVGVGVAFVCLLLGGLAWPTALLSVVSYSVVSWAMHVELYRARPATAQLTSFYLWLSVGGCLGGVFNALLAPLIFDRVIEYPLVLALAAAWMLRVFIKPNQAQDTRPSLRVKTVLLASAVIVGAWFSLHNLGSEKSDVLLRGRSFYSSFHVEDDEELERRLFVHGTTVHGVALHDHPREPVGYYARGGPVDDLFSLAQSRGAQRVAVIGLGCGGLAGYHARFAQMDFFEIDPLIRDVATSSGLFDFVPACGERCRVIVADGRRALAAAANTPYDLIVIDAYNSDVIPVHLVTLEAIQTYRAALQEDGLLAFHISNRFVNLETPLATIAQREGLTAMVKHLDHREHPKGQALSSDWMVYVSNERDAAYLRARGWRGVDASERLLWTDEHADVLAAYHSLW